MQLQLDSDNPLSVCLKTEEIQGTCIEIAGHRAFGMHTDFSSGVRKTKVYGKLPNVSFNECCCFIGNMKSNQAV
jgi:hypothetical protein